ncbi:hypothetical protein BGZ65_009191, partial [Modicella reniformis]
TNTFPRDLWLVLLGTSGYKRKVALPVDSRNNHNIGSSSNNKNKNKNNGCRSVNGLFSRPKKPCAAPPNESKRKNNEPLRSRAPRRQRQQAILVDVDLPQLEWTHAPNQIRSHICEVPECRRAFSRKHDLQ